MADDADPLTVRLTLTVQPSDLPWDVRLRAALKALGRRWGLRCTLVEFPADDEGVSADEGRSDRVD